MKMAEVDVKEVRENCLKINVDWKNVHFERAFHFCFVVTSLPQIMDENLEKKIKHRELERSRHHETQSLIKMINERVPRTGTQVRWTQCQILKRATSYCQHLIDVYQNLASSLNNQTNIDLSNQNTNQESSVNEFVNNEDYSKPFINSSPNDHFDSKQLEELLNQAVNDDKLEIILPLFHDYLKDIYLDPNLVHQTNLDTNTNEMISETILNSE